MRILKSTLGTTNPLSPDFGSGHQNVTQMRHSEEIAPERVRSWSDSCRTCLGLVSDLSPTIIFGLMQLFLSLFNLSIAYRIGLLAVKPRSLYTVHFAKVELTPAKIASIMEKEHRISQYNTLQTLK